MIQKQINLSDKRVLIVEVPESAKLISIHPNYRLLQWKENIKKRYWDVVPLPPGSWKLIGVTPLTEEQAGKVAGSDYYGNGMYMDYEMGIMMGYKRTALESFHSLLVSHELDTSKRYAVMVEGK